MQATASFAAGTTAEGPAVWSTALRRAWGQFATGVAVITVQDGEGARGMTANSFTSISLDPPLVLVAIDRRARTGALLSASGRCAISVLAEHQRVWSERFAGYHGNWQSRFMDVPHHITTNGLPILDGALASFVCRVVAIHPAGDHVLFVAAVEQFETHAGSAPLIFFESEYRSLAGHRSPVTGEADGCPSKQHEP
jgi:flavin reductase (DIM6/NTAB) family NADH-FMN oxidoreductase RutF